MSLREKFYKAIHEKNSLQRRISRLLFEPFQAIGFHLTADHFYDNIPNTRLIERTYSDAPRPCVGIEFPLAAAEEFLINGLTKYSTEINSGALFEFGFSEPNGYFRGLDPLALYMLVRERCPKTIVEVGQGMSTRIIASAAKQNWQEKNHRTRLISIDPYTRAVLDDKVSDWMDFEVKKCPLQTVGLEMFEELGPGDLLFIDSSHVFKYGSDVEYEFDHIYPAIQPGVLIHIHDIFSPYEYPKRWLVRRKQFWNEQYMLENFLRFNTSFRVVLPVHMTLRQSSAIKEILMNDLGGRFEQTAMSMYIERIEA